MKSSKVFVSYSHDSPEHDDRVLALSDRLRKEGVDCTLDQYEESPPEGWPKWMDRQIETSDFVLVICTETYCRRAMGTEEKGKGLGAKWESTLAYQHIYDAGSENTRFIPVVFRPQDVEHIPNPLRGATHYCLDGEEGYERLYRRITYQPETPRKDVGKLRRLPPRPRKEAFLRAEVAQPSAVSLAKLPSTSPDLFGREKELAMLDKAWESPKANIVSLVAWGGVGKTALVNVWLNRMQEDDYRGAERVLGWSFYSQGAAEGRQVSADPFVAWALEWFGDPDPRVGSPWDKGERLARLANQQRTLLVLDGLEPLQNPPGTEGGKLKDRALQTLLRELVRRNLGLCIITTRLEVDDLKEFEGASMKTVDLEDLSPDAGVQLLSSLGVKGTRDELQQASEEFGGHALALTLLGRYLAVVHKGDIRQRDKVGKLTDEKKQGAHARRVMESYERWFAGRPELDILHIMGLFDRPAERGAVDAVRARPLVEGLTSNLANLSEKEWQYAVNSLREARLLAPEDPDSPGALDAHPLVREHFGERLKESNPPAWREAHSRLYEHYKSATKEYPDTLEEMAPLYAAVAHGCQAGRHQEALGEVFWQRIDRGAEAFASKKLGAFGADLAAVSSFFEVPWTEPARALTGQTQAGVLQRAGFCLRAVGRLGEAAEPMRASLDAAIALKHWRGASAAAESLSELCLIMGDVPGALQYGKQDVELADRAGASFERITSRTTLADVLLNLGCYGQAAALFREAEEMQKGRQPWYPMLYALQGYRYCDLLLEEGKWQEVLDRSARTLQWAEGSGVSLLSIGLGQLAVGRGQLLAFDREGKGDLGEAKSSLDRSVEGLRQAGTQHHLPRGLLARAELHRVQKEVGLARHDLDEAMTIATRCGMRLHEADGHLGYARLHLATGDKEKALESLAKAKSMVTETGYHRRDKEVEELEKQLGG